MSRQRIIAIGLLTDDDLRRLGPHFHRAYPVDETPCFGELLRAIDEADRELWRSRDRERDEQPAAPTMIVTPRQ